MRHHATFCWCAGLFAAMEVEHTRRRAPAKTRIYASLHTICQSVCDERRANETIRSFTTSHINDRTTIVGGEALLLGFPFSYYCRASSLFYLLYLESNFPKHLLLSRWWSPVPAIICYHVFGRPHTSSSRDLGAFILVFCFSPSAAPPEDVCLNSNNININSTVR